MSRFIRVVAGFVAGVVFTFAAEPAWVARSNEHAKLLLELDGKYNPEGASGLGLEQFDEEISDYSRDLFEPANADTRAVISGFQKRLGDERDDKVKQHL